MIPTERLGTQASLELLDVLEQRRLGARIIVPIEAVPEYFEIVHGLGLVAIRSPYTFDADDNYATMGGSSTIIYVHREDPRVLLEAEGDHRVAGAIYGYPECCVDHFARSEVIGVGLWGHGTTHAEHLAFGDHPYATAPWWMNTLHRGEHVVLSHHPCSLGCAQSEHIGRKRAAALHRIDPFRYDAARALLSGRQAYLSRVVTFI